MNRKTALIATLLFALGAIPLAQAAGTAPTAPQATPSAPVATAQKASSMKKDGQTVHKTRSRGRKTAHKKAATSIKTPPR